MKNKTWRKLFASLLVLMLVVSVVPAMTLTISADGGGNGTPYDADGNYDVTVEHVVINQVYGGSDDGYVSHSFIELYNPTDYDIDLTGWQIQYKSSDDGDQTTWISLTLSGTIPANGYFLIRCGAVTDTSNVTYTISDYDQEWDIQLYNKGLSVVLLSDETTLSDDFTGEVTDDNRPENYVDLVAVQGNDEEEDQVPPVYEKSYSAIQSKKKAVRRSNYSDTDNNADDLVEVNYSKTVSDENMFHYSGIDQNIEYYRTTSFVEDASLSLELLNSINIGDANADGGVAEIVAYNSDTEEAYVVNGQDGLLVVFDVDSDGLTQTKTVDLTELDLGDFVYGDMTSVAVDTVNDHIAVSLQAEGYADNGIVVLLDYDLEMICYFEVGVQPDMVCFTEDGSKILTANEGEPRAGYGEGTTDPEGSVTVIDLAKETITNIGFGDFTAEELTSEGILLGIVNGETVDPQYDLEPEYIAVSGSTAYVSLQEANAIAIIDLESCTVTSIQSLGFKDLSDEDNAIDLVEDDEYGADTYTGVYAVYMPDTIATYEVDGVTYIVTANEGDAREWPEGDDDAYDNERKEDLTSDSGTEAEKVRTLHHSTVTLPTEDTYIFGGRSFSIYTIDDDGTLTQVYDSGNDFEEITAEYVGTWFNCSNDDTDIDSRSSKKGPEPEGITIGTIGDTTYAFIGLERVGGIMVYDISDPDDVTFVNYINTRDYSEAIAGDVSPEGLAFAALSDGTPILLAAYEVSGTVAAYSFDTEETVSAASSTYEAYTVEEHHGYEAIETVEATCEEDGYIVYQCTFCNDTYTEVLSALGHSYVETWTWASDYSSATLTLTCENDESHVVVLVATVESTEVDDEIIYTASVSYGDQTYTDALTVAIESTDESSDVETGDTTNRELWMLLLLMMGGLLGYKAYRSKKSA